MDEYRLRTACKDGDHEIVLDICQKDLCAATHTFPSLYFDFFIEDVEWLGTHGYDVTCLHVASAFSRIECCRVLLDCGADVEAKDEDRRTPLMYAKSCEVVQLLLSRGANANTRDQLGLTALHHCASFSLDKRCVGELVLAGASVTAEENFGRTPLMMLIEVGSGDVRQLDFGLELVKRGADANTRDEKGRTLLHMCSGILKHGDVAVEDQCSSIVNELTQLGADLDARTVDGKTPLHFATENGQKETVCQLIKLGANVNAVDNHGRTALIISLEKSHFDISLTLISAGTDVNMSCEDSETALHRAAKDGHSNLVQDLVKACAGTEACDNHGNTPLLLAAKNGHTHTLCALVDAGAAVDACNRYGETAVHLAAKNGHTVTVVQLAAYGAPFDLFDLMGKTPLFCAMYGGFTKAAHELRKAGASQEAKDKDGNTFLHHAVKANRHELVKSLVKAGANLQAVNREGESALLLAAKLNFSAAAMHLLEVGTSINERDNDGNTPLSVASKRGNGELCWELMRNGAKVDDNMSFFACLSNAIKAGDSCLLSRLVTIGVSINECDKNGSSALHVALTSKHPELAEWIVKHGGNVSLADNLGQTPLHIAATNDYTSLATKLLEAGASAGVRDNDGNTPLSVVSKRGNSKLCCELVHYGAKIDDTVSLFACLSNAAKAGNVSLLSRLLTIGASINERDENGSSLLHVTLNFQRVEIAEWIIEHGGDVSLANASGLTPLHLAAQLYNSSARLHVIKLLLAKGADPTAVTSRSETALGIAKQHRDYVIVAILEKAELAYELAKVGGVVGSPDSVAIRFGGPPGAGKSTLANALQVTRIQGLFRYESQTDQGATNMHQRTKGINCHTFVDEKSSRFTIFDLGGHGEFLATHQMFIGDGSVPVIDCVVVSALDEKLKDNALKWCSHFASRNQPVDTPWPLILVATRADKATQQQKNAVCSVYCDVKQTFNEHFRFPCSWPLFIDARKSWSKLTVELRQVLSRLHRELVDHGDSQLKPAICQCIEENLPALRKTTPSPVILKEQFYKFMLPRIGLQGQTEVEATPAIVSLFNKALKYLSGYATVLSFSRSLVERYVVINPQWLLSDIVGRLMAEPPLPGPHVHYDNGYAKTSEVVAVLGTEHLPGREALEMVAGLGFCLEQKSADTILNPSKLHTYRLDKYWRRTAVMVVNAGRRLKCKGTVAIASAFFSHLQVHFYHRYLSDYDERLPMWNGGIRLVAGQRSSVEAIIESDPSNRSIDIIVRGREGSERDCSDLLHSLTEETLQKATEISPGSQLLLFFLSKLELDELSPAGLPSRPLVEFSEERVLRAISCGEYVTDGDASTPESPDDLLLPCHFQQRSKPHEVKAESAGPLTQTLSTKEWRVVLLRVANAVNSYDECHGLAEGLQLNIRGEDIVKKLLQIDPRRLTSDVAYHLFERWLQHGASELSTEQRRRTLDGVLHLNLRRPILCDILTDELRAACNESAH